MDILIKKRAIHAFVTPQTEVGAEWVSNCMVGGEDGPSVQIGLDVVEDVAHEMRTAGLVVEIQ